MAYPGDPTSSGNVVTMFRNELTFKQRNTITKLALIMAGNNILNEIDHLAEYKKYGKVVNVVGLLIHVGGVTHSLSVGDHCIIHARGGRRV